MITRRLVFAVALAASPAAALAQAAAPAARPDPLRVLRAIYANPGKTRSPEPFSRRLAGLAEAARKRSRELDEPVAGLDFDYAVNGQDHDPGLARTVRYEILQQGPASAEVKVAFRNGGPQELRYDLVLENGRWLIDDVRSLTRDNAWTLSALLREGAATPRS